MKELTEQERKRIKQLERIMEQAALQIEWIKDPFERQFKTFSGEWVSLANQNAWNDGDTYRRKPAPRFVPWTREDAEEFRGIWVRNVDTGIETQIDGFDADPQRIKTDSDWMSLKCLFDYFTKLDGTPCGKEEK